MSITEYCHTLRNIVDVLADVDHDIDDVQFLIHFLINLPLSYHNIVKPFPFHFEIKKLVDLH